MSTTIYESTTSLNLGDLPFSSLDELKSKKADPKFTMKLKVADPMSRKTRMMTCYGITDIKNDGKEVATFTFEYGTLEGIPGATQLPLKGVFDMSNPKKPKYTLFHG